jgi:hypothetical protein
MRDEKTVLAALDDGLNVHELFLHIHGRVISSLYRPIPNGKINM